MFNILSQDNASDKNRLDSSNNLPSASHTPRLAKSTHTLNSHGEPTAATEHASSPSANENDIARLLTMLLNRLSTESKTDTGMHYRSEWKRRHVLVCANAPSRDTVTRVLSEQHGYQVELAANTSDAANNMREGNFSVMIVDQEFAQEEQGLVFVKREINLLRTNERRRIFLVHISPTTRTADAHAAFLNNVNLIVNSADVEELPYYLKRGLRSFNEFYHDFNRVFNLAPL